MFDTYLGWKRGQGLSLGHGQLVTTVPQGLVSGNFLNHACNVFKELKTRLQPSMLNFYLRAAAYAEVEEC